MRSKSSIAYDNQPPSLIHLFQIPDQKVQCLPERRCCRERTIQTQLLRRVLSAFPEIHTQDCYTYNECPDKIVVYGLLKISHQRNGHHQKLHVPLQGESI